MWLYKIYITTLFIILFKYNFSNSKRISKQKDFFSKRYTTESIKFFDVSVTSTSELEAIKNIKDHVEILEKYNKESNYISRNTSNSKKFDVNYIEDEILFMESFISSFSSQSNLTTPFSTNGVSINVIPTQKNRCKSNFLFEANIDDMELSIKNHLISNLIPEFDQINRTLTVIPWDVIDDSIYNKIPEIQKMSFKFSLICTAISNNIELLKYYSKDADLKHTQWDALQMASFARGYSRYLLEATSLASTLLLIAFNSKLDPSFMNGTSFISLLKYPRKILENLKEKNIESKVDYKCMEFFQQSSIKNSCSFCSTLYLTLFSRLQCQYVEIGISREAILGLKWIEEIHSHIIQLYKFVSSLWNTYSKEFYPNSSQYTPPKPFVSWKAFKLKLYDEFRISLNFQHKIEQSSILNPSRNFVFSKINKKDDDINNYIELKIMDSISNLTSLKKDEVEIVQKILDIYNEIVHILNSNLNEILMGSINKLSNSLISISLIIGTYGSKELIDFSMESILENEHQLSSEECKKLHREFDIKDKFSFSVLILLLSKYLQCKYDFDIQVNSLFSIQYKYDLSKQILRKIVISTRNLLFEKIRQRYSSLDHKNDEFINIFVKVLSQFQIMLGIAKIIRQNLIKNLSDMNQLISEIDYCTLSLEKFKIKFMNYIFNKELFLKEYMDERFNIVPFPLVPLSISIGPSIFDTTGSYIKKTINKLRSKISLLNKLITFTRNILVERRNIIYGGENAQEKNFALYSKAFRLYNNKDELFIADEFTKIIYKTLKVLFKTALKSIPENDISENINFDFGENGYCNLKNDVLALKNSPYLGCRLYSQAMEIIQIDELYALLQKQFISIDNSERKIYFEISTLFDEIWPKFESTELGFRKLSSKLYLLKTLLENMLIFNGISKNSLVPYIQGTKNYSCLFDFLVDTIDRIETTAKEIPIYINKKNSKLFFKSVGSAIKGIFVKKERIKRKEKKDLEKEVVKLSKILLNLEAYIVNIDVSFKVNLEKLSFIRVETANRIKNLFYLYIHCIYTTLRSTILKGTLSKRIPEEAKNEWSEFIEQLNVVQASLFNQLNTILVS